jgi:Tfp pilus assembly protein PilF
MRRARACLAACILLAAPLAGAPAAGAPPGDPLVELAHRAADLASRGKVDEAIRLLQPRKDASGVGGRRVRLELGELLIRAGRRAEATGVLMQFADEYNSEAIASNDAEGLAMVGRAMDLLRRPKEATTAYNESERAQRGRVETLLWRARMWLDHEDPGHAQEVLQEALQAAPRSAEATALLARLKLDGELDFDGAEKLASEALALDPREKEAYAVRAGIALRDGAIEQANAAIDAGLAIDPGDLELLSLRAAARYLADDHAGFEAAKREIFARNKEYGRGYGIISEYAEWEHRYDDVVAMMKEAVRIDPGDSRAWAQLGLVETRAGDEAGGVQALEESWKGDHSNVRAYNTLNKLYREWIPAMYASARAGVFEVRYPVAEKAVLERYVPAMLDEAWTSMVTRYGFTPTHPVAVELYSSRQHFSVRTSGLPSIGIDGVCFGRVVAAMSPQGDPVSWGNVLWHELAHVFAIQLSKSHVPRWFTEGLSEYETMIRRPEWRRELDPKLYVALVDHRVPRAVDMNRAFTHAQRDDDVEIAYYASSQMVAFTAERFGMPAIRRALELWGEGKRTPEVIRGAFGLSSDDYDDAFRAWAKARLARYDHQYLERSPLPVDEARAAVAAQPESAAAHATLARALASARHIDDAAAEAESALRLDPNDLEAHFVLAKIDAGRGDIAGEEQHLRAMQRAGGDGHAVEIGLAAVAHARHDTAAMRAALEAANRFDPAEVDAVRGLYEVAAAEGRQTDALMALSKWATLDQHDHDGQWERLLEALIAARRWADAVRVGEAAMFVAVERAAVHFGYARALAETGDHKRAAYELESALLCDDLPAELKPAIEAMLARERGR